MKIAIDAMGGDNAPKIVIEAVNEYLENNKTNDVEIVLYGDETEIKKYLKATKSVEIVHTTEKVSMDEKNPLGLMRSNKETSMAKALYATKEGYTDAFLTAGPTGPFVAGSQLIVKRIPEMSKCALCVTTKNIRGEKLLLLDCGANIDVSPVHLAKYAKSGSVYAESTLGIKKPLVGLISNGVEEGKGRELERETYKLLKEDETINFHGYIESSELFTTNCSVIVSDGFTANAVMKTAEGTLKTFTKTFKEEISSSLSAKIGYMFMKKSLKNVFSKFDQSDVGAAILLGINAAVLKAHGSSTKSEFLAAIYQTEKTVRDKVVSNIMMAVKEID